MFKLFTKENYDSSFVINLKGLIQLNDEDIPRKILITKERFSGDYYTIINTLFHYAALIYLMEEEKPTRLDFNDWANKAYIETVSGGNRDER